MADASHKVPQNVSGRFFVDTSCIFCELCTLTAPGVFKEDATHGWAYVFQQPTTREELAAASEALEGCPTESIGADDYDPAWRAPLIPPMSEEAPNQSPEPTALGVTPPAAQESRHLGRGSS